MSNLATPDMDFLSKFVSPQELAVLESNLRGEESEFFKEMLADLEMTIKATPELYDESKGIDAAITLHYFFQGCDWWIATLDIDKMIGFGFTRLNNNNYDAELGYIYIPEIVGLQIGPFQPELDLYWDRLTTLRDVMEKCGKDTSIYNEVY